MSILNVFQVTTNEVLIAVDTAGIALDGSTRDYSKALIIPHLPAVLCNRGQGQFLNFQWAASLEAQSYDDMLEAMTSENLLSMERFLIAGNFFSRPPEQVGHEMIAVGFSHRQGRMLCRAFVRYPGAAEFTISDVESAVSPWDAQMGDIPKKPAHIERLARAQVRWLRSLGPEVAGGGDLILYRVTKKGVEMRHALTFPVEVEAACA